MRKMFEIFFPSNELKSIKVANKDWKKERKKEPEQCSDFSIWVFADTYFEYPLANFLCYWANSTLLNGQILKNVVTLIGGPWSYWLG